MKFVQRAEDGVPRVQAREAVKRLIRTRGLRKGDRLPTYTVMAKQMGFAILTIQRAMDDLADEGVVYRLHGKGTFVGRNTADAPVQLARAALVFPSSPSFLVETPHLNRILSGILVRCGKHNVDLNILSLFASGGKIAPGKIAEQAEGALLLNIGDDSYLESFVTEGVPAVAVDLYAPDIPLPYVAVDNAMAIHQVMEHLVSLGHRRIGYVEPRGQSPMAGPGAHDAQERREGYLAFMQDAGQSAFAKVYSLTKEDGPEGVNSLPEILSRAEAPTALVAYDEALAATIMTVLAGRGIRVPEAVSLAAAAGTDVPWKVSPLPLTCGVFDFRYMGGVAVDQLVERCKSSRPKDASVVRIASTLAAGGTTGRPAAAGK